MLNFIFIALILITLLLAYVFWIRPILAQTPKFKDFYAQEDSFWAALSLKMVGIKQKLTTVAVFVAGFVVTAYDSIISLAQQVGFDWANVQTITSRVPSWMWPIGGMLMVGLVGWFRQLSEKRTVAALEAKGIDAAAVLTPLAPAKVS